MNCQIIQGDCIEVMPTLPADSVDSIVTDPPYGLAFMGKDWDHGVPGEHFWREALRVAKPGAHLLAFGGTRTFHRLAVAIEDAGWEIRDTIMWVYSQGFPKSLDLSKAIDKAAGAEREKVPATGGLHKNRNLNDDGWSKIGDESAMMDSLRPATALAKQFQGWGTALKPAWEPIIVARKPLEGTVAANVLKWGAGAINVDGCRVGAGDGTTTARKPALVADTAAPFGKGAEMGGNGSPLGRWPANLIHDGSEMVMDLFPVTGPSKATPRNNGEFKSVAKGRDLPHVTFGHSDQGGSAARFFYCAKASRHDRNEGCKSGSTPVVSTNATMREREDADWPTRNGNHHPTVKPTDLMRYLCRLVTPPGGTILDPFTGSRSTGKAAIIEGFNFIGIEREAEYVEISRARIAHVQRIEEAEAAKFKQVELAL